MSKCEQICYQQWVDMYNKKDKESFTLQLKLSRIEELANIIINTNCNYIFEVQNILKIIRGEEMTNENKKYDNQTVARRLTLQTLNNIDNLSLNDIKRRLTDIIECLSPDDKGAIENDN